VLALSSSFTTTREQALPCRTYLADVDARQLAQALPELTQASLHQLLALQRGLVLTVFAQIAHFDRSRISLGSTTFSSYWSFSTSSPSLTLSSSIIVGYFRMMREKKPSAVPWGNDARCLKLETVWHSCNR